MKIDHLFTKCLLNALNSVTFDISLVIDPKFRNVFSLLGKSDGRTTIIVKLLFCQKCFQIFICTPTLSHSVTPKFCSTPPCSAASTLQTPHFLLCLKQVGVRSCILPLFWINLIQFSGRYKPDQCGTPFPTIPLSSHSPFLGRDCVGLRMVLKVPKDGPSTP